ncbi:MAG: DUF4147 domain-containing protein, partial [Pseudomonadota bacterium]
MSKNRADLRAAAKAMFLQGVAAADPEAITAKAVKAHAERFHDRQIAVIATGKAAIPMMRGALSTLAPGQVRAAIAVTNRENFATLPNVEVYPAGHPMPDLEGARAVEVIQSRMRNLPHDCLLLVLISGGTSAMLPAPVAGLTFADEVATTKSLLESGAPIDAVNAIRRRISTIKGGGLSRLAGPMDMVTFMLSDVPGDDPSAIGSGPTIELEAEPRSAIEAIIDRYNLRAQLSDTVIEAILAPVISDASPAVRGARIAEVIGSNAISLKHMTDAAEAAGYPVQTVSEWLDGDVGQATRALADAASNIRKRPIALVAGGETTVQLVGNGEGGRNQELALRFALQASEVEGPWVLLSGGTDGRDGPTDAAGGIVDDTTISRLGAQKAQAHLDNNDAYHALQSSDD